ncbi:MAG: hypothetical protein SGBAC_009887 [Bacillariaceae sp.]
MVQAPQQPSYDADKYHNKSLFATGETGFRRRLLQLLKPMLAFVGVILVIAAPPVFRVHGGTSHSPIPHDTSEAKVSNVANIPTLRRELLRVKTDVTANTMPQTERLTEDDEAPSAMRPTNNEILEQPTTNSSSETTPQDSSCGGDHQWDYNCTLIPLQDYVSLYQRELLKSDGDSILKPNLTLWQTWKDHTFPGRLEPYWQRVMTKNPDRPRKVLVDAEIDAYVKTKCAGPYWKMYNQTNPSLHALRADLWRYCALFADGGVYMDADVAVNTRITLSSWIGSDAVLTQGGNHWDVMIADCRRVWSRLDLPFPSKIMTNNSLVQWAMVFPRPKHPILREVVNTATNLIEKWDDSRMRGLPMKARVVCLSGPAILAISADRVYRANHNSWDGLGITFESGTDYDGKLVYKNYALLQELFDENNSNKRYDKMEPDIPLKVSVSE